MMKRHGNHKRARLAGDKQYEGKMCKQCKGVLRWTDSANCVVCNGRKRTFLADRVEPDDLPLIKELRDYGMQWRTISKKFEVEVDALKLALKVVT